MEPTHQSVGVFYSWWRGDPIPVSAVPNLTIAEPSSDETGIEPTLLAPSDISRLRREGNRLYVACHEDEPVAWGWSAMVTISIGELGIVRTLPPGNRYLWGFVTRPAWRGRRIYPRLLQEIVHRDTGADRFWIGHEDGNEASARGILKAGFQPVGEVFQAKDGAMRLVGLGPEERTHACEEVFGVPIVSGTD